MALSLYLSIRLMISEPFRDHVLARLTFMRERDEREALLTGKATGTTLILMLILWQIILYNYMAHRLAKQN